MVTRESAFMAIPAVLGDMLLPTVKWLYNIALTAQNHVRISDSPHQKLLRYMISISCD